MFESTSDPSEWLIKRNCSAGPRQLALVLGSLVAVSFAFGVGFAVAGLWMVLPFVGVELIAVAAAFVFYGRHAADFERIALAPHALSVEQIDGADARRWQFDPKESRVQIESRGSQWGKRVHVYLLAPGFKLELGLHLLDHRRLQLARELDRTLMQVRAAAFN